MENLFEIIIKDLKKIKNKKDIPVICLVFDDKNKLVMKATNSRFTKKTILGHAEINALNKLYKKIKYKNFKKYTLVTTLEPCKMCVGAIEQTGIKKVMYYIESPKFGYSQNSIIKIEKINDVKAEEYLKEYLKEYFKKLR